MSAPLPTTREGWDTLFETSFLQLECELRKRVGTHPNPIPEPGLAYGMFFRESPEITLEVFVEYMFDGTVNYQRRIHEAPNFVYQHRTTTMLTDAVQKDRSK